jgi:ribosomal protein S18 acetylase RimI-like enzyme
VIEGQVRGYVCLGRTPLTVSTWHLYWICVHPAAQGRGVGRALQSHAEGFVRAEGGERLVLETSGRTDYGRARGFYRRAGYQEVGRIKDFYRRGDDCVLFCKPLV